ncbi:MAG: TIR domain-containing protein [Planctomycetes bacterium]|nr:TIR domain-containing protein [Planctomycetota bacterium]
MSYSSADRPVVRRIQRFLESYRPPNRSHRLRVYLDETDMRGGSLPENLSKALEDSRALVVCWSEEAARSSWVKSEITEFRDLGQDNRIAIVHVGGAGTTVEHEAFSGVTPVEHDLRRGWRARILRPAGKTQLLRLIAFLTDVDMRALRNWALRRTLRNALITLAVAILPVGGVLSVRIPTWDPVSLSHYDRPIEPLASEVVDGKLWVSSWTEAVGEVSGARAYFVTYPDVLTDANKEIARPQYFTLPKRALPETMVSRDIMNRVRRVLDENGLADQFAGLNRPDVARVTQPRPNQFVYILPFGEPTAQEQQFAQIDRLSPPETTSSIIVVHENGSPPRVSTEPNLSPPRWRDRTADNQRRTSPARGMSVAWQQNGEIWIGVPGERDTAGSLWHSPDAGKNWKESTKNFYNVTSIDLRPTPNHGEETVVVAEQSFKRPHYTYTDAEFIKGSSGIWKWTSDGNWIPSDAPPHGTDSEIEICGRLPDGTLYIRVDKQLYRQQRLPLYRWLIELFRSSNQ